MSVGFKALKFIEEVVDLNGKQMKDLNICCMGHLNTKHTTREYMRKNGYRGYSLISSYFKALGCKVSEIDVNCRGMALPLDLGRIITHPCVGTFDLIVDGGTAEHIDDQQIYWNNVFNLLRVGGISVHMIPYKGAWANHSTWRYDFEWMDAFVRAYRFQIVDAKQSSDDFWFHNPERLMLLFCIKKTEHTRVMKFPDPIFDEAGSRKDKSMYGRFVLPVREKNESL